MVSHSKALLVEMYSTQIPRAEPWRDVRASSIKTLNAMKTRAFCGQSRALFRSLAFFISRCSRLALYSSRGRVLRKYVFKRDLRNDGLCTRIQRVEWRSENKVDSSIRERAVATRCVALLECVPCNPICRCALPSLRRTAERKHAGCGS